MLEHRPMGVVVAAEPGGILEHADAEDQVEPGSEVQTLEPRLNDFDTGQIAGPQSRQASPGVTALDRQDPVKRLPQESGDRAAATANLERTRAAVIAETTQELGALGDR